MTLFKRVFNNHTNDVRSTPLAVELPEDSEASWAIEDDLAEEMADMEEQFAAHDPAGNLSPDDVDDLSHLVEAETSSGRSRGAYAKPVSDLSTRLTPVTSPPVHAQSLAERAALAQNAIEQSQFRRPSPPAAEHAAAAPEPNQMQAAPQPAPIAPEPAPEEPPTAITAPRPGRGARRVRTRMLGFNGAADAAPDPFDTAEAGPAAPKMMHPVGWMVVVAGPGEGHAFAIYNGVSTIGRSSDQSVPLDFGDTSISREKHAAVAYDDETNAFFLGHGGKSNIVRLNNRPVLSTEDLAHGDTVRIGETTLRFVALCGADFAWGKGEHADT